jgi:hypothetical protein
MLKESITPQDVCDLLNELLEKDYDCIHELISYRVKCNQAVADHPTVQVQCFKPESKPKVGLLGILNGLFGVREDLFGIICMEVDGTRIVTFKLTPERISELPEREQMYIASADKGSEKDEDAKT